jgi:hypothetical protein
LLLTLAVAVTLVLLVFARDVTRSAHQSTETRRSENRSFGGLANALIVQQNTLDGDFADLLRNGSSLTRPVFDARLQQLHLQLSYWSDQAELLRHPRLAHDVSDKIGQLTEERVDAYDSIFSTLARALTLPTLTPLNEGKPVSSPAQVLITTAVAWNSDRYDLKKEPGRVRLDALTLASAKDYISFGITNLTSSPTLAVVRGIGIAAVSVLPAPLPAKHGELLLAPVHEVHVGVVVENTGFVNQFVKVTVTLTPSNGPLPPVRQSFHTELAPLQSYAFVPKDFATVPSERATLIIAASGGPAATSVARTRTYSVILSPSGN